MLGKASASVCFHYSTEKVIKGLSKVIFVVVFLFFSWFSDLSFCADINEMVTFVFFVCSQLVSKQSLV
jgi:hypothetical protein